MNAKKVGSIVRNTLAALLVAGTTWIVSSGPAAATQQFATQTGQPCGACHQNPKGGGALTADGDKFKANGNKMPTKTDASPTPK